MRANRRWCSKERRVIQIKLAPNTTQAASLDATMQRFNAACNWVAEHALRHQLANRFKLHKLYYYDVRNTFDLPVNLACVVFHPRRRDATP